MSDQNTQYNIELLKYKIESMMNCMDDLQKDYDRLESKTQPTDFSECKYDYFKTLLKCKSLEKLVILFSLSDDFEEGSFTYENTYRLIENTIFEINILIDIFNIYLIQIGELHEDLQKGI